MAIPSTNRRATKFLSGKDRRVLALVALLSPLLLIVACTVRTPTTETPAPGTDEGIEKSFFVETQTTGSGADQKFSLKPKTFLCGMAPLSLTPGALQAGRYLLGVQKGDHCNMEFQITENALIGRLVNPSFPNDRSRWKEAIVIPIKKHYYYEKDKDGYGRDTNKYIENTGRSHWSARPLMELSLGNLQIHDWELAAMPSARTGVVTNIEDIEWDKKEGFLGFTASMKDPEAGGMVGAKMRFNFKEIKHNTSFKPTPFHPKNGEYLNAVFLIGEKIDGVSQVWSAAKWDLSKTHDIYLYDFPEAYIPLAEKMIESWNNTFAKIGQPRAFRLNKKPMKYPYDLRYPMLTWIKDVSMGLQSIVGVGSTQSDFRNGEIVWGQIVIYGEAFESYAKSYLSPSGASSSSSSRSATSKAATSSMQERRFTIFPSYFNPGRLELPPMMKFDSGYGTSLNMASLPTRTTQAFANLSRELDTKDGQIVGKGGTPLNSEQKKLVEKALEENQNFRKSLTQTVTDFKARAAQKVYGQDPREVYAFGKAPSTEAYERIFGKDASVLSKTEMLKRVAKAVNDELRRSTEGVSHDTDRRLSDVASELAVAITTSGIPYEVALRRSILQVLVHEMGHVVGLGHQFKENIIPDDGSVPQKYIDALKEDAKDKLTNATSVMGYGHPMTEVLMDEKKILPGPQDELVLRYLYNGEYATFRRNSGDADFTFFKVPASGLIPPRATEAGKQDYVTSYFPQCNDFDASFSMDPYCNRFDRGYNAETIVSNYLENDGLEKNLVGRLYALSDSFGGNVEGAEEALFQTSLRILGRVRMFYDFMRQTYADELQAVLNDETNLKQFSRACSGQVTTNAELNQLFAANPKLKELCIVNGRVVKTLGSYLVKAGPDFTRMDYDGAVTPGSITQGDGVDDMSRIFGAYKALTVMPIKVTAMNVLTTAFPYVLSEPWMFPIPRYAGTQGMFTYSTLYPFEFTDAMANAVKMNLNLIPKDASSPTIGRLLGSMGYFLGQQSEGKDVQRGVPERFIEMVRDQTNFRLSMKALILDLQAPGDSTRVKQIGATLYDPNSNQSMTLTGGAYLLPGGKVIVRPPTRNFIYPVGEVSFISNTAAIVWAYHVEYDVKEGDAFASHGVKYALETLNSDILNSCLTGNANGLKEFFNSGNKDEFPGFLVMDGITNDPEKQRRFQESITENFKLYEAKYSGKSAPTRETCEQARHAIGLIAATAGLVSGAWLPETIDWLAK